MLCFERIGQEVIVVLAIIWRNLRAGILQYYYSRSLQQLNTAIIAGDLVILSASEQPQPIVGDFFALPQHTTLLLMPFVLFPRC